MKLVIKALAFIFFILCFFAASAQEKSIPDKRFKKFYENNDFRFQLDIPVWVPGFRGEFAYGDVELDGENGVDPENPIEPPSGAIGKILNRLFNDSWTFNFYFVGKATYTGDKLFVSTDFFGGSVSNSVKFLLNNSEIVNARFTSLNWRFVAGWKIYNVENRQRHLSFCIIPFTGARVFSQSVYSDKNDLINKIDVTPVWSDFLLGIKNSFEYRRWQFNLVGDYGFYLKSGRSSYQFTLSAKYLFGRNIGMRMSWTHLQLNYKGLYRGDDLLLKISLSGPSLAVSLNF